MKNVPHYYRSSRPIRLNDIVVGVSNQVGVIRDILPDTVPYDLQLDCGHRKTVWIAHETAVYLGTVEKQ